MGVPGGCDPRRLTWLWWHRRGSSLDSKNLLCSVLGVVPDQPFGRPPDSSLARKEREDRRGVSMPIILGWTDVATRLALTILAGTLIGINRSERGRPAGLRTTLLVCL